MNIQSSCMMAFWFACANSVQTSVATVKALISGALVAVMIHVYAHAQVQSATPVTQIPSSQSVPWDERSWEERAFQSTYEDRFTFKHKKTYAPDPFIWAYGSEFAERFRMPKEWIDPGLKGALAVAWRMTTIGQVTCGLSGKSDNCWSPLTCQMDIYFDSKTALPWRYTDVVRDNFMRGIGSFDYLPWRSPQSRGFMGPGSRGVPLLNTALLYVNSRDTVSGFQISYFDRQYESGIVLIGFLMACPRDGIDGAAVLKFFSQEEQSRTRGVLQNYAHQVEFSPTFMKRITDTWIVQNKPNQDVTQRLMQDFFNSRRADPNFTPRP